MLTVVVLLSTLTAVATPTFAQTLDDQVRHIASQLMCPVCEGRPVSDSPSELAGQMRAIIREKLQGGYSAEQIIAYFVDRYGESALAAPPPRGLGLIAWLAPVLAILGGMAFLIVRFRGRNPSAEHVQPLTAEERHRLQRLLGDAHPEGDGA
jgi:cytochrome c-type biogenesis protein CcmH